MPARKPEVDRLTLEAVSGYVREGWPILPLAESGDRLVSCMPPRDVETAMDWWSDLPYGVAGVVGPVFDVLEMSAVAGRRVMSKLNDRHGTISVAEVPPTDCWLFFVTPGSPLMLELAQHRDVVRLRNDGWVPLPPTPTPRGRIRWVCRGRLAHSLVAQSVTLSTVTTLRMAALVSSLGVDLEGPAR